MIFYIPPLPRFVSCGHVCGMWGLGFVAFASLTTPNTMPDAERLLTRVTPDNLSLEVKDPVDPTALAQARDIIRELRGGVESGPVRAAQLQVVAARLGDIPEGGSYLISKDQCRAAFDGLAEAERTSLRNIHRRVERFARAQRASVTDMEMDIPGGRAGHTVSPCRSAGCYAPGGRYPLPSSVIMTAVTARAAGCDVVVLASPRPAPITLAAAHVAGADKFLGVGGAQAIAALAYGMDTDETPKCDVIVGPGNQWVTAAKSLVNGYCGIDMLAGPSEVLVICDDTAKPGIVAADLIAQAEHDVVARAIVVSTSAALEEEINAEVGRQLATMPEPNQSTARAAMRQSFSVVCATLDACIATSDVIAPEHLEIHARDAMDVLRRCRNYGGAFVGEGAAEVLGDYGAGPNHTLPTGGTGRYTGGLSVFDFLRIRTWMRVDDPAAAQEMVRDTVRFARLEGLEGHARAGECRLAKDAKGGDGTTTEEKKD